MPIDIKATLTAEMIREMPQADAACWLRIVTHLARAGQLDCSLRDFQLLEQRAAKPRRKRAVKPKG